MGRSERLRKTDGEKENQTQTDRQTTHRRTDRQQTDGSWNTDAYYGNAQRN